MHVLDSSAIIEAVKEGPLFFKIVEVLKDEELVTTSICMQEVLAGALNEKERFVLAGIFSNMRILEHNVAAALAGSRISRMLAEKGMKINAVDVLIAGICKAHNSTIVTLDKDFAKIKEIKSRIIQQ